LRRWLSNNLFSFFFGQVMLACERAMHAASGSTAAAAPAPHGGERARGALKTVHFKGKRAICSFDEQKLAFTSLGASDDLELGSASDSETNHRITHDIETWDIEESFGNSKPETLQNPQPLQSPAKPPPLQIVDPQTLAMRGPQSPFLGHRHSQENEAWLGFNLQSPSEYGDGETVKKEGGDDDTWRAEKDCAQQADDPTAGLEFLDLSNGQAQLAAY
jgi:hypothetical protein